jgi:hypothetical protein
MTKRDILSISLKILGVFSIIYAARQIPNIAYWISLVISQPTLNLASFWYLFGTITSIILALVVAYILLRWGDSISKRLMREDSEIPALGKKEWEEAVFKLSMRIVGVVCLTRGIPGLFNSLTRLPFLGDEQRFFPAQIWGGLISAIVLLIIGVYLISGAKRFVKLVLREAKTA